jgi:hypothetical protein
MVYVSANEKAVSLNLHRYTAAPERGLPRAARQGWRSGGGERAGGPGGGLYKLAHP